VTVVQSTGNKVFDETALRALERATFEPGSLNGKPIESSYEMKYTFVIKGAERGAHIEFIRALHALTAAIQSKDRSAADVAMTARGSAAGHRG